MNDEYITKDLGEAAALLCKSTKLLRLQGDETFYWFVFANKSKCRQIGDEYWFGTLKLNAKSYNEALRRLKDRLFAQKKS